MNSADYLPAAPGTNLFAYYAQYATRSEYVSTSGAATGNQTSLDSYVNLLRYVHFFEVAGFTGVVQTIVPVGTLYNGKIGGVNLGSTAGFGDPIFSPALWLVNNKATESYFAVAAFIFAPLGQYSADQALNMGENRWKLDLQAGYYQGLGNGFALELAADVIWYGANSQAGDGDQTLTQDNSYQFQAWLSYAFAPTWSAAVGWSKYWGGTEYLSGIPTGNATDKDQLRFEISKFITPTFQVLAHVQRDYNTSGGFPEDFRGTLRLVQIF
ncbi:transporter [Xanthobacter sp. KR7-225]|uniref:transporter n=1 Tax=Xanthobacter sp. KR7-225 TaxID=3156613 RepID=UPI0032B47BDF